MGSKLEHLRPEDVAEHMRPFVDFTRQELRICDKRGHRRLYVWVQCPDCQQWRWAAVSKVKGECKSTHCHLCAARSVQRGSGPAYEGWRIGSRGYRRISILQLSEGDAALAGAARGLKMVGEHRLVIARCLGRPLESAELVHHVDGMKDNNRPDNLMIMSNAFHAQLTRLEHWAEHETLTAFTADGVPYRVRARVVFERTE